MTAAIQGTPTPLQTGRSACYVYCVALVDQGANLGAIGIEGQEVSPVLYQRLGALVHDGPALPYQTHDQEVAQRWVLAHHQVV
ncbi:MAG: GvpL/GvpF family gas vesicle protein, partial [Chloroflexi bacterium]|nr:GvpL/GvpF family gas vesicle protein [Chloroflexota bacterium]